MILLHGFTWNIMEPIMPILVTAWVPNMLKRETLQLWWKTKHQLINQKPIRNPQGLGIGPSNSVIPGYRGDGVGRRQL